MKRKEQTGDVDAPTMKTKKMKLKKDKKKKLSKKEKKKALAKTVEESGDQPKSASAKTEALEYLKRWKNEKAAWHFQKVRQVWLLQHMYDSNLVDDSTFVTLIEYLDGLKGNARTVTISKAEELIDKSEEESPEVEAPGDEAPGEEAPKEDTESTEKTNSGITDVMVDRAKQLLQSLS